MKSKAKGIRRLIDAALYSVAGIRAAWRNEEAFRIEAIAAVFLVPAAFYISRSTVELALLVGTCLIVLITELVNSAIETIVDRIGDEYHELSGRAKDIGSAAVFISLIMLLFVWGAIILDRCRTSALPSNP